MFVINWSDFIQFCQYLAEKYPREIWNKHVYTAPHISIFMFTLYLVKTSNDYYGIQYSVKYTRHVLHFIVQCPVASE